MHTLTKTHYVPDTSTHYVLVLRHSARDSGDVCLTDVC